MDRYRWCAGFLGCIMMFGLLFAGGCKRTVTVNSRWANEEIVVDGQDYEWRTGGLYYDEKTNTKIGIRNDAQNLYLCMIFKDENIQRQVSQKGLTLWVSRDKKKNKLWGLCYPVGGEGFGDMGGPEGSVGGGAPGNRGEAPPWNMDGDKGREEQNSDPSTGRHGGQGEGEPGGQGVRVSAPLNDFELLSSEDDSGKVIRSEELAVFGIEGRFSQQQEGGLVYEIKIPLNKTEKTPYAAVPSKKGGYLIGFLSEKTKRQGIGNGMDGGGRGGSMGGGIGGGMGGGGMDGMNFSDMGGGGMGRGGMGGGDMGRGGMDGSQGASSMELWAMIKLATGPASGS